MRVMGTSLVWDMVTCLPFGVRRAISLFVRTAIFPAEGIRNGDARHYPAGVSVC